MMMPRGSQDQGPERFPSNRCQAPGAPIRVTPHLHLLFRSELSVHLRRHINQCMRILFFRTTNLIPSRIKLYTHAHTMSTKPQFLCMVHDHPGTMQKRIEVRQAHLSVVGNNKAVVAGGNDPPNPLSAIDRDKN